MEKGKEILERHRDDMWRCAHCSLCKYPPLMNVKSARFAQVCCSMDYGLFHAWSGGGKLNMGLSILEGRTENITEEMRSAILQCTLCGACDVSCKYSTDIEVLEGIFDLRKYLVEKLGPHPIQEGFADNAEKFNNPYGEPHDKRQDWIRKTNVKENSEASTLFFTGCTSAYRQKSIVQASVNILTAINKDFQLSKDEYCCGSPIYRSGMVERAKKFFNYNIELFNKLGIKEVITACPGCYSMFVAEYPNYLDTEHLEFWNEIKFYHMTEVIDNALRQNKIKLIEEQNKPIITYHDPCHLGRGAEPYVPEWKGTKKKVYNQITVYDPPKEYRRGSKGIYDAPRNIFKRMSNSVEFVEMYRVAEYAYCCGSGGGVKAAYPEMALNAVVERLEEADYVLNEAIQNNISNAEKILVSACPFCKTNFENGLDATNKNIKYLDINQLVWERMVK